VQGDLGEFGIPDILQLLGNQQKTGILHVSGGNELADVQVYFRGGKVIRCDVARRDKRDLLGNMLLGAGAISREQLDAALKVQKQTLRPLGDILVEQEAVTPEILKEFTTLQAHEALYRIFEQKKGSYRFEARPAGFAKPTIDPVGAEQLLMEGFRRLDEWPLVRTRINNYETVYRRLRELEDVESEADALERILDDAFSETVDASQAGQRGGGRKPGTAPTERLGKKERRVLRLVDGKADVYTLIDRSRLGEFETCKALVTLLNEGCIAPVKARPPKDPGEGGRRIDWLRFAGRVAVNLLFLAALVGVLWLLPRARLHENAEQVARESVSRLRSNRILAASAALEVYRIEEGSYPDQLPALETKGLLDGKLLVLPGQEPFDYLSIGVDYDLR
jgi:hypothetical protein